MLLPYYARYLPNDRHIDYHLQSAMTEAPPEWVILQSQAARYTPPRTITDARKQRYVLSGVFPFAGLSGCHWALYQRADARQPPRR